jgi:hypothetical protein
VGRCQSKGYCQQLMSTLIPLTTLRHKLSCAQHPCGKDKVHSWMQRDSVRVTLIGVETLREERDSQAVIVSDSAHNIMMDELHHRSTLPTERARKPFLTRKYRRFKLPTRLLPIQSIVEYFRV